MSEKNCWLPLDMPLEDLEPIILSPSTQQLIGCILDEDISLECPFAFVDRDVFLNACTEDPILEHLSQKFSNYDYPEILIGYTGIDFIVCTTIECMKAMIQRNRQIINVARTPKDDEHIIKSRPWKDLGSAAELAEKGINLNRNYINAEIEIPKGVKIRESRPFRDRRPCDARDGYVALVPRYETFENVFLSQLPAESQTHLVYGEQGTQTYPGHPKNAWTQYEFQIPEEFSKIWDSSSTENLVAEDASGAAPEGEAAQVAENEAEDGPQQTEEEILEARRIAEKRIVEGAKLKNFLNDRIDYLCEVLEFNAKLNLYVDDVSRLGHNVEDLRKNDFPEDYKKSAKLEITRRGTFKGADWHRGRQNFLISFYQEEQFFLSLWDVKEPFEPIVTVRSEYEISVISCCPVANFFNVVVIGTQEGKVLVWEVDVNEIQSKHSSEDFHPNFVSSTEKSHELAVVGILWSPQWCRIDHTGKFRYVSQNSPRMKNIQFSTASADGSVSFWRLPHYSSNLPESVIPSNATFDPIYRLFLPENINPPEAPETFTTGFYLAIPEIQDSTSPQDQSRLDNLRKVFIVNDLAQFLCFTWEGEDLELTGVETCQITSRAYVHDGVIDRLVRCPYLEDVFMTVGGRVFALWKEDLTIAPIFSKRSDDFRFSDGAWSSILGILLLTKTNGSLEVWDIRRNSMEPVIVDIITTEPNSSYPPKLVCSNGRQIAISTGPSDLLIYVEPCENPERSLDRQEWLEEFAWREARRKLEFHKWQDTFLREDPEALQRRAAREERQLMLKRQKAREQLQQERELQARIEAERAWAKRKRSPTEIRMNKELERARKVLLKKKGFIPEDLEVKRRPLVLLEEQKKAVARKTKEKMEMADQILEMSISRYIPEVNQPPIIKDRNRKIDDSDFVIPDIDYEKEYEKRKPYFDKVIGEQLRKLAEEEL